MLLLAFPNANKPNFSKSTIETLEKVLKNGQIWQ